MNQTLLKSHNIVETQHTVKGLDFNYVLSLVFTDGNLSMNV